MVVVFFVIGLIIGSFLNVCIYRLPRGESIVTPPSHCPACGVRLSPADLIPVVSYLLLRGKCRYCAARIHWRYPLVELLTGGIFAVAYSTFGLTGRLSAVLILVCLLIVITFIDFEHSLIFDVVNYFGTVVGLISSILLPGLTLKAALAGMVVGGGVLLLIAALTRGGIGGGDVKMGAMIGTFLGWRMVLLALFLAFVCGAVIGLLLLMLRLKTRKDYIPFGPYIALGTLVTVLWGQQIMNWYLQSLSL